jgi:WD40 repeat protein
VNGDALTVSQDVGRRFFIGMGSGRYRNLPESAQLPKVAADIRAMREEWTRFGYVPVLPGLGEYDGASQIKQKLSYWCADTGLTSNDVVVLYFAGHGIVEDRDRHYLLCWDSREEDCAATALPTEDLVRILCKGELRHLLVVLDTCAGGAGAAEAATAALRTIAYRQSGRDVHTGLWFLASARRKDVADDGAFVADLRRAVQEVTERTGQRQRYLDLTELVAAINDRFTLAGRGQRAELEGGLITGLAPFLPNAGFREDLPPVGTDLEIQRRVAGQDLAEHFGPRSRGVEFESEQGLYFSGREAVLRKLVAWLTATGGDGKGRVITGSPGCGKSAVLGRIVATSIAWYRARLDLSDVDPATVVPEGCVTAAVHARHKRLEEITDRIADAMGLEAEGTAELLQELARHGRSNDKPLIVVIDALDEAGSGTAADAGGRGEPRRIARELLRPMSEIPGVRLLVGTRRELISAIGPTVSALDLDDPEYRNDEDVAGYVRKVLLAAEEPEAVTPYRGDAGLATIVAQGVAKRADGVFLVARMTARSLRHMDKPVDVFRPRWIDDLPSEIGAAFDDWLGRFGLEELRVRRMLLPLAFAEGHGLPRGQIWSRLASILAGVECTEHDITWTLTTAQAYIAEVVDDGRSAYRLYHQALAEHLRASDDRPAEQIQELLVEALISTVPAFADRQGRDWFAAAPYVRQHLATHAQASGELTSLIEDPGFLLASGQMALLSAFPSISGDDGRRIRTAYEQVAHRLTPEYPLNGRAADLQLSARRCGADALADRVGDLGLPLPWLARWSWWSSTGAHRQLSGHTSRVTCVATVRLDDRPIAVTGSGDETARVWDLITQQQIGKPLSAGVAVSAVAAGDLGDYTVALVGGVDGDVRVWDLSAGQEYGAPLTGHTNQIEAIALRSIGGRPIALTASGDGTARIWDLSTRAQIGPALAAHRRTVRAAALGELDGRPIAITGGDDQRLYIWDLSQVADGGEAEMDGRPLIGLAGAVTAVALGYRQNRPVAVVGDEAGMLSVWDLKGRQQIGEPVSAHAYVLQAGVRSVAIGEVGASQAVLTCGAEDARLWDLDGLRQRGHPLRGHVSRITGVALTQGDDRPMGVTVSDDETARIWDLTADQPATGHVQQILAVAFAEIEGRPLAITGAADGTARLWDLRSRLEIGQPMEGHTGDVLAVALGFADGRLVAVTAGSDATIRLWDPLHGRPLGTVLEGHTNAVGCLELIECHRRLIAVTGSEDGTIRLWDITERRPLGAALTGHIGEISYLAVRSAENDIQIVAATRLDHVYLWRVASDMTHTVLEAHLDLDDLDSVVTSARTVGVAFHHQQAVVLAAHDDNKVRTYDVATGALVGQPLSSHSSRAYSAAAGRFENGTAIAIIGYDGLRLWELETARQIGEQLLGDMNSAAAFVFAHIDGAPVGLVAFARKFQMCDLTTMQPIGEPLCGNDSDVAAVAITRTQVGRKYSEVPWSDSRSPW